MRTMPVLFALALAGCDQGTPQTPTRTETALKKHEGKTVHTMAAPHLYWHTKQDCPDLVKARQSSKAGPCGTHKGSNIPCVDTCPGRPKEAVTAPMISGVVRNGRLLDEKQNPLERDFCPACEK